MALKKGPTVRDWKRQAEAYVEIVLGRGRITHSVKLSHQDTATWVRDLMIENDRLRQAAQEWVDAVSGSINAGSPADRMRLALKETE